MYIYIYIYIHAAYLWYYEFICVCLFYCTRVSFGMRVGVQQQTCS